MDFSHSEVREERLALVAETVAKYPVAGFELQLNYSPHYFHPAEAAAGCAIMTEWVAKCHAVVKASGTGRILIIRVPCSLEGCLARGLDVAAWLERGIVDLLVTQVCTVSRHAQRLSLICSQPADHAK